MITKDLGLVTAYAYAVSGGYTGTEAEFTELLGNIAEDLEEIENLSVTVETLPPGSEATASYADGVLHLGIPRGDKGEKGDKGDKGDTGETGPQGPKGDPGDVSTEQLDEAISGVRAEMEESYARNDGYYEEMTVGDAEQLISTQFVEDTAPYLFRPTGGSADVGNREYLDKIVGGTVAWNQLCNSSSVTVQSGRKYLLKKGTAWSIGASTGTAITGLTSGSDMLIDITAMFGSTIADYIYSLEQATAGAGVAWFRRYFPEDYYPYDAGTLKSVQTSAHKTYDADGNVIGTYPLDSSLMLRGVPKLVDGKLAFDGDVYPPSGEVDRRYKLVDLGTLAWTMRLEVGAGVFSASLTGYKTAVVGTAAPTSICSKYPFYQFVGAAVGAMANDKTYSLYYAGGYIYVYDTSYTDIASFKAAMSGVYLVYELDTSTTETADGYEQYQICDPSGTEEFITDSIVPVGHETRYPANLRDKLQHLPDLPSPLLDGTYMVMVNGSQMRLEKFLIPDAPTTDGTYTLKATVSGGTPVYTWEVEA